MANYPETISAYLFRYSSKKKRYVTLMAMVFFISSCSPLALPPPLKQNNICHIFQQQPRWYGYAKTAEQKWGTSIATQMAFIQSESSFNSHIRPPAKKLLGFIHWNRPSSAYGFAQAQNPVWQEYLADNASPLARRTHMKYATDFIGWYNQRTQRMVDINLDNPTHLYLAYHEGQTGYRRGSYQKKPHVIHTAREVGERAKLYSSQLAQCEQDFQCQHFYQIGPFCKL
ncbi:lysozyme-like domain containing protein [Methylophaga sp. SB9B]|uniref:transglycosylase SLT domain-containing protein n=1 Tax=Methylophaga sp. SB9B TaxID=2570356 RepID=UPI001B3C171E|nr:lysozyme-like domain containing protein [Methylophaga sp. SB9B]